MPFLAYLQLHGQYFRVRAGLGSPHVARLVALDRTVPTLVALLARAPRYAAVADKAQDATENKADTVSSASWRVVERAGRH